MFLHKLNKMQFKELGLAKLYVLPPVNETSARDLKYWIISLIFTKKSKNGIKHMAIIVSLTPPFLPIPLSFFSSFPSHSCPLPPSGARDGIQRFTNSRLDKYYTTELFLGPKVIVFHIMSH